MLTARYRIFRLKNVAIFFAAGAALAALACSNTPEPSPAPAPAPPAPAPAPVIPAAPDEPKIVSYGIFEKPDTRNYWNYIAGPGGSVWTGYVLDGVATTLYDYSHQRFDWIPILADGFPSDLVKESIGGQEFWTSQINLKRGVQWSDGKEITADDFVFVVNTALEMELGGDFSVTVDPDFVDHVEALDPQTLKVFFKATDEDGNPQLPGLSVWQFGLAFTPILAKHYWEPVVAEAKLAGDIDAQQEALFGHVPENEPTAGGFVFSKWEAGAFYENEKAPNWFREGTVITQYSNGAYQEDAPGTDYDISFYGQPVGEKTLELTLGPHVDSEIFNIYGSQDAAILALANGDIDYVFNPLGLEKGFQDKINSTPDLTVVTNPANSIRYLGFNVRKAPFNSKEFRQAVAILIDKEFVTGTILQGAAFPIYSMVPEGNVAWHQPDVTKYGFGLSRAERMDKAVALLKSAGFTYEVEPVMSEDGNFVEVQAKGLRGPDGQLVPEMDILTPSAGYDPLRSTFAIWIERWLNDAGIPARAKLTSFGVIVDTLFSENVEEDLDMWIFGWSLSLFPSYLEEYFHSDNIGAGSEVNWGGYSNPQFDVLAEALLEEQTIEGARAKVFEMQEFIAEDLPYVTLFSPPMIDAYRSTKLNFPYTESLGGIQFWNGLHKSVRIE
ncbi:MAG: ABC transporter substrate-binding protein [Chloroflexi bacterium]|nr:ABC transporter substrate-binding protein [Chloroflexota bacterium]